MTSVYERFRNIYQPSFYNEFCRKCRLFHISAETLLQFMKQPNNRKYYHDFVISAKSLEQMMKITKWLKTTQKYTRLDVNDVANQMMDNVGINEDIGECVDNYDVILFSQNLRINDYTFDKDIEFYVMKYKNKFSAFFSNHVTNHIRNCRISLQKCLHLLTHIIQFCVELNKFPRNKNIIRDILQHWFAKTICCINIITQKSQTNHPLCIGDILFADEHIVKNIILFL